MDHFCPWVANTIGFFNRKFFILLLLYTALSTGFLVGTSIGLYDESTAYMVGVIFLDSLICFAVTCFFLNHLHKMLANQTTIEVSQILEILSLIYAPHALQVKYEPDLQEIYDLGSSRNTQQILGPSPLLWFLPVYASGPVGDGINWPTSNGATVGMSNPNPRAEGGAYAPPMATGPTRGPCLC